MYLSHVNGYELKLIHDSKRGPWSMNYINVNFFSAIIYYYLGRYRGYPAKRALSAMRKHGG